MTQIAAQAATAFRPPAHGYQLRCLQGGGPVTGQLFLEVLLPEDGPSGILNYDLTLWPQARLGDVTIEARAVHVVLPEDLVTDLLEALRGAGYTPLGPVRAKVKRAGAIPAR